MAGPKPAFYLIKDWLSYLGVPRYGASASHANDANGSIGVQDEHLQNPYVLAHESFHIWLFKAHGINNEAIRLSGGKGAYFGPSGKIVKEYFGLCEKAENIVLAESSLPESSRRALARIFGAPEEYDFQSASPVSDAMISAAQNGQVFSSHVGNLVDESSLFQSALQTGGHPMHSYHEFFASTVTTLLFDGDVFFRRLSALKAAAGSDSGLRQICSDIVLLLGAVSAHASGIPPSIEKASAYAKTDPSLLNLKSNLQKLNSALSEEPRQRAALGR